MALFCCICESKGLSIPNFSKDRKTGKGYCRSCQSYRTDIKIQSIQQRAIEKHKAQKKLRPGTFVMPTEETKSILPSSFVPSEQEVYDAEPLGNITYDEPKMWEEPTSSSLQNLIQDLDAVTSLIVRHSAANDKGEIKCFTCDRNITIKTAQCSHFIKRAHMATRFRLDNCVAACVTCNEFRGGNLVQYELRIGKEKANELREASKEIYKPSVSELKQLLQEYRQKLSLVKKKV